MVLIVFSMYSGSGRLVSKVNKVRLTAEGAGNNNKTRLMTRWSSVPPKSSLTSVVSSWIKSMTKNDDDDDDDTSTTNGDSRHSVPSTV